MRASCKQSGSVNGSMGSSSETGRITLSPAQIVAANDSMTRDGPRKSVETIPDDGDAPVPPAQLILDEGTLAKLSKQPEATANNQVHPAPEIGHLANTSTERGRLAGIVTRPRPAPRNEENEQGPPPFSVLEATLVEDDPEEPPQPVYDAVAVDTRPFFKRHRKLILGVLVLLLLGAIAATIAVVLRPKTWKLQGEAIVGEASLDKFGYSVALSSDGRTVAIGAPAIPAFGAIGELEYDDRPGYVQVYRLIGSSWTQIGETIRGRATGDRLGESVALSLDGKTLVVGAPGWGDRPGYAQVYRNTGSSWRQFGETLEGEADGDQAGYVAVSADGQTLAIGARNSDGNGVASGQVRAYQWDGSSWKQLGGPIHGEAGDQAGSAVSLSADGLTMAIGVPSAGANDVGGLKSSSHVLIYRDRGELNWTQLFQLGGYTDAQEGSVHSRQSLAIALSSNATTLAVGKPNHSCCGIARVFRLEEDTNLAGELVGHRLEKADGDNFGVSVALSEDGNVLAIGINGRDGNGVASGQVKIYKFARGNWKELGDSINGQSAGDNAGWSVALSADGKTVAIGSVWNDDGGDKAGHVRVFTLG